MLPVKPLPGCRHDCSPFREASPPGPREICRVCTNATQTKVLKTIHCLRKLRHYKLDYKEREHHKQISSSRNCESLGWGYEGNFWKRISTQNGLTIVHWHKKQRNVHEVRSNSTTFQTSSQFPTNLKSGSTYFNVLYRALYLKERAFHMKGFFFNFICNLERHNLTLRIRIHRGAKPLLKEMSDFWWRSIKARTLWNLQNSSLIEHE